MANKIMISKKKFTHLENAKKYATTLKNKGFEARAFNLSRGNNRVEFRKARKK